MELRLDMCQKLIPYIYKTVTLETASHGSLVGNPVQTDIMRSVLTVLLPNGQMDIPLDDILSISCFGMETLRFDNAASAQPAAPAVPTTPAPVPSSPVAPAAPPVAEESVAAPEPVNPLELAPKKEPQKQLTELLIDGDLSAALALATEPEALQHQGYTEEETAQITAQLRADKLPNGHTPEAIAQRLWRVVGNHAGLAKQYARKALPGTLSLCFSICEAEKNWDAIAELGKQYPENVQGEITMLRSYALALQNSGKNEELLALAAANPVVLHQKTLYPALGELAKNYSDTKPEEAALIAEAAVHVNAYPDREVRTPFERLLLGDYDENALRPYRGANCVEMLCKQGYTAEQAAKIADRMPRINADTYELERGARLAVAQENIHYLSEYYLWEELLTSPDKAVGRLALHMQGNTGTDANGQPIGKRDAEYIQLYRVFHRIQEHQHQDSSDGQRNPDGIGKDRVYSPEQLGIHVSALRQFPSVGDVVLDRKAYARHGKGDQRRNAEKALVGMRTEHLPHAAARRIVARVVQPPQRQDQHRRKKGRCHENAQLDDGTDQPKDVIPGCRIGVADDVGGMVVNFMLKHDYFLLFLCFCVRRCPSWPFCGRPVQRRSELSPLQPSQRRRHCPQSRSHGRKGCVQWAGAGHSVPRRTPG